MAMMMYPITSKSRLPIRSQNGPSSANWSAKMLSSSDRKSTRLNSSHSQISYAVFCLKKKKDYNQNRFLVTSRPSVFRSHPLSGVTILAVRPFTPEHVDRFVHKLYLAHDSMTKQNDDP